MADVDIDLSTSPGSFLPRVVLLSQPALDVDLAGVRGGLGQVQLRELLGERMPYVRQGVVGVGVQICDFAGKNAHHAEQQLTGQTQRQWHVGEKDAVDTVHEVRFENLVALEGGGGRGETGNI